MNSRQIEFAADLLKSAPHVMSEEKAAALSERILCRNLPSLRLEKLTTVTDKTEIAKGLTAESGSLWSKVSDHYHLFEGKFEVGANLKAKIFGGEAKIFDGAEVTAFRDARLEIGGRAKITAQDNALVVTDPANPFKGILTLSGAAQLTQNKMNFLGEFVDKRKLAPLSNTTWLLTSTVQKPFIFEMAPYSSQGSIAQKFAETRPGLVQIRKTYDGVETGNGSGFWLGDRSFSTAAHVVSNYEGPLRIKMANGKIYDARVEKILSSEDVAILTTDSVARGSEINPLHMAAHSNLKADSKFIMLGFPGIQNSAHMYPGRVINSSVTEAEAFAGNVQSARPNHVVMTTDAMGHPGTSGGPVIDLESGSVIGTTLGGRPRPDLPTNEYSRAQIAQLLVNKIESLRKLF